MSDDIEVKEKKDLDTAEPSTDSPEESSSLDMPSGSEIKLSSFRKESKKR